MACVRVYGHCHMCVNMCVYMSVSDHRTVLAGYFGLVDYSQPGSDNEVFKN